MTPVYKNFKGKQLCLSLKNDQLNVEKVKKLEEYSGLEGTAVFDYCAKIGVIDMATESWYFLKIDSRSKIRGN